MLVVAMGPNPLERRQGAWPWERQGEADYVPGCLGTERAGLALRAPVRSYWQIHWQMWGPEGYRGGLSLLRISNLLI